MYPKIPAPTSATTTTATTVVVATPVLAIWGRSAHEKFKRIGSSIYIQSARVQALVSGPEGLCIEGGPKRDKIK